MKPTTARPNGCQHQRSDRAVVGRRSWRAVPAPSLENRIVRLGSSDPYAVRTAFLVDIDNLCRSGQPDRATVEAMFAAVDGLCAPGPDDQVYCAGTYLSAWHAKSVRSGYCTRVGRGPDGADHQLLALAEVDFLSRRFDRVVIGSGDHIFADRIRELVQAGLGVDVFARYGSVARELRRALGGAGTVIEFDIAPQPAAA